MPRPPRARGDPGNFDEFERRQGSMRGEKPQTLRHGGPESSLLGVDSGSNRPGGASGTLEAVCVDSGRTSKIHESCKVSPLQKISRGLWAHTLITSFQLFFQIACATKVHADNTAQAVHRRCHGNGSSADRSTRQTNCDGPAPRPGRDRGSCSISC